MAGISCALSFASRRAAPEQFTKRFFRGSRRSGPRDTEFLGPGIPLLGDKILERKTVIVQRSSKSEVDPSRKWQLCGSVCLERPPVVSSDKTRTEEDFWNLLQKMEFERSLLSDHELSKKSDAAKAKAQKKTSDAAADEEVVLETAQDREDRWNEQFEKFSPGSRVSDSALEADFKSRDRKLDRKLYLVVDQKLGEGCKWVFPQATWKSGESLKDTAERALQSTCGVQLKPLFLSSVPVGIYKYKYPPQVTEAGGFYGAKVFFFKAITKKGIPEPSSEINGYKWVTRQELENTVLDKYFDQVERFLFEFNGNVIDDSHENLIKMHY